jgi:hypothetical protein
MRRFRVFCLSLLAITVVGSAIAVPVFALPSVLLLPSDAGKSLLLSTLPAGTALTKLQTALGEVTGEGISMKLHFANTTSPLGTIEVTLTNTVFNGEKCKTEGAGVGEIVVPKTTFHLVFDSLTVLGVAALILVPEFAATCGVEKIKFKGNLLSLLKPINTEILTTEELSGRPRCSAVAGVPEDRVWWSESGAVEKAKFEAQLGAGFEEACMHVALELKLKPNIMFEIMG